MNPTDHRPEAEQEQGPLKAAPLGGHIRSGMAWTLGFTAFGRALSLASQIVLAKILSEGDFGVFAICTSILLTVTSLKDGGLRQLLVQRGPAEFKGLVGPAFWLSIVLFSGFGLVIAGTAWPVALFYGDDRLLALMLIAGASVPLGAPAMIYQAKLQQDMRFREATIISAASSCARFGGQIGLAVAGVGPLSFVIPLVFVGVVEWAVGWWYVRDPLFNLPAEPRRWMGLLHGGRWLMAGTFATAAMNYAIYMLVGRVVPTDVTGQFYFAFSIVIQVGMLLSANIFIVLLPALQRLTKEPARFADASTRAAQMTAVAGAFICLPLIPMFEPIELFIWKEKWIESVPAVELMALLYPFMVMLACPLAAIAAHDRSKSWAIALGICGISGNAAGLLLGWYGQSAAAISLGYAGATAIAAVGVSAWIYRSVGVPLAGALTRCIGIWVVLAAPCLALWYIDRSLWTVPGGPLPRAIALGFASAILMTICLRTIAPTALAESLKLVPGPLRPLATRVLRLQAPSRV